MTCVNCGRPLEPGALFCANCGTRAVQTPGGGTPGYTGAAPVYGGAPTAPSSYSGGSPLDYRLVGTTLPVLEINLQPGQSVVAQSGELSWMTNSIGLRTSMGHGGGGGLFGLVKRAVGGGSLFMTEYTAMGQPGMVAFATKLPGQIMPVSVQPGQGYLVHRHGFLCATPTIELSMGFQRSLGSGVFGGTGFILQKLAGTALAWVELSGEVVPYDLAPGETLRVHPGHVGMFEERVSFDITMISGISNALFGGDGLFLAALTGPGKVWLQTLPLPNLAHALQPYLSSRSEAPAAQSGGIGGAIFNDLFQNQ